jgi:tetratricopeptide (TPR) repeat protein
MAHLDRGPEAFSEEWRPMNSGLPQASNLEAILQRALEHHLAGRPAEAERLYRDILHQRPDHAGANSYLAIALKDQGKVEEAADLFRRAVASRLRPLRLLRTAIWATSSSSKASWPKPRRPIGGRWR